MSDQPFAPAFNLNRGNLGFKDEDEFQKSMEGGRGFTPGKYDLVVVSAGFHMKEGTPACPKDPTWFNVVVEFAGADDRKCKYWVQVPTTTLKFGAKGSMFPARKLVEFLAGMGLPSTLEQLPTTVAAWFANPAKLVGRKCNVDIDYDGPHAKEQDGGYVIVRADGKAFEGEDGKPIPFPDRDSAKAYAEGAGITLRYPSIVKFNAAAPAKKADDDKW